MFTDKKTKRLSVTLDLQVKVLLELENNDILIICATVIAGALIFLTIQSVSNSVVDVNASIIVRSLGFGIIIFFSIAAVKVFSGKKDRALKHMRNGFLFMLFMAIYFVIEGVVLILYNATRQ